ncbi:MAG: hypothetical protein FK730_09095, partial [Asgard group archaeon]|nr:hypothetical protein [Asgard group archaeon]
MPDKILRRHKLKISRVAILILISISLFLPILIYKSPMNFGNAHSTNAVPKEIFSLWNNTIPTLDGIIGFDAGNMSYEWTSAAVYDMYDVTNNPSAKVILQNNDVNMFIAFDMTEYQTASNPNTYGCAVYLDRDHDGRLSAVDRAVSYKNYDNGTEAVIVEQYSESLKTWEIIELGSLGVSLGVSKVLINSAFTDSYFESINHRQYELRIPLTFMQVFPGNITGIGLESFYDMPTGTTTWPGYESDPDTIGITPEGWGDLFIGKQNEYAQYVIEENFNIKSDATGLNNNTFLTTGDINGDGDQELIVGSNRQVSGDENLLAIYDYVSGELTRIWSSWTTSHQSKMILPLGIATYDFDEDSEDEIYVVSNTNNILRLYDWNSSINDFDSSGNILAAPYATNFNGYVDIGDADNDGNPNPDIVVGAIDGRIVVIQYNAGIFSVKHTHGPATLLGSTVTKVQAIEIADMDADLDNEIIYAGQITSDDNLGTAAIQIIERSLFNYVDNPS